MVPFRVRVPCQLDTAVSMLRNRVVQACAGEDPSEETYPVHGYSETSSAGYPCRTPGRRSPRHALAGSILGEGAHTVEVIFVSAAVAICLCVVGTFHSTGVGTSRFVVTTSLVKMAATFPSPFAEETFPSSVEETGFEPEAGAVRLDPKRAASLSGV